MELNEHLAALAIREKSDTGNILPAYEVKRWPAGRLDELVDMGELVQIEDATSIKCPACSKGCSVDPVRGVANDGTEYCEVLCELEGSLDIDPFYLKQWQITEKIRTYLPRSTNRKKKKTAKKKVASNFKPWDKGKACFVHHSGVIKFYYKKEVKEVPFQKGSQAPSVLVSFIGKSTLLGKEIKNSSGSDLEPSQIIRNINRTTNTQLRKLWPLEEFENISFLDYKDEYSAYELLPNIVKWEDFKNTVDIPDE